MHEPLSEGVGIVQWRAWDNPPPRPIQRPHPTYSLCPSTSLPPGPQTAVQISAHWTITRQKSTSIGPISGSSTHPCGLERVAHLQPRAGAYFWGVYTVGGGAGRDVDQPPPPQLLHPIFPSSTEVLKPRKNIHTQKIRICVPDAEGGTQGSKA